MSRRKAAVTSLDHTYLRSAAVSAEDVFPFERSAVERHRVNRSPLRASSRCRFVRRLRVLCRRWFHPGRRSVRRTELIRPVKLNDFITCKIVAVREDQLRSAKLIVAQDGTIVGTTLGGGVQSDTADDARAGTIYSMSLDGGTFERKYVFGTDGGTPQVGVIQLVTAASTARHRS